MLGALGRGTDVYLFLIGMMALAAYARLNGIFDALAAIAVRLAGASHARLFVLVYAAGIGTTALLSNDATIVALMPAVIAAVRRTAAPQAPYVIGCALIANAASFVLPISNPSNLLVFAGRMPPLGAWLRLFAAPSLAAIAVTLAVLWLLYRRDLRGTAPPGDHAAPAPAPLAVMLLAGAVLAMVAASALRGPLGLTTMAGGAVAWIVSARAGAALRVAREISWSVVALTALLFVVVGALDGAGGTAAGRSALAWCAQLAPPLNLLSTGFLTAAASNVINNLPVGLSLGETLPAMHAARSTAAAAFIGVNLGPNATLQGSIATLLWLGILRRERIDVGAAQFFRAGVASVVPALAVSLLLLSL